jgi:hypothetical protein
VPKYAKSFPSRNGREYVRRYQNPNRHEGEFVYRSVTNVTGALPKTALLNWYAVATAQEAVEQLVRWGGKPAFEAIAELAELAARPASETVTWLQGAPARTRDRGAARGSTVHAVIDNMLQGRSYEVEATVEPWIESVMGFVQDARPQPERTETSIYDERTRCAGTFDFLGRLAAAPELGRVLIDWKTSKGIYPDQAVQLVGGYMLGAEYILDDNGQESEWQEPDTALIVHFTQTGYAIRRVPKDRVLRRAFLGALEIRKWEEDGPAIEAPYQLRLDVGGPAATVPSASEIAHVKSRLRALAHEQQLAVSAQCAELGIPTRTDKMTVTDVDRVLGLISLYEMGKEEPQPRRASRPMP